MCNSVEWLFGLWLFLAKMVSFSSYSSFYSLLIFTMDGSMVRARLRRLVVAFWFERRVLCIVCIADDLRLSLSTMMLFSILWGPIGSTADADWGLLIVLLVSMIVIDKVVMGLERSLYGRVFWARFVQGVLEGRFLPRQGDDWVDAGARSGYGLFQVPWSES